MCNCLTNKLLIHSRHSVKLSIDEQIFGDCETKEEFIENITQLDNEWYIGSESEPEWSKSIEQGKKYVFTLGLNSNKMYSCRTLTLSELPMYLGQLNTACVRAIWSALSVELLYLTNDDEERYSIQAHPNLLRNVVTQAADVPLGYPIYFSGTAHLFRV